MNPLKKQKTMMMTKNMLWAALSMTAALVMTACSNDDNLAQAPETTEAPATVTIPYTVTVSGGDAATTRAAVDSDNKTLRFATGDKLYVSGTDIKGVLTIQTGAGETENATFSGELTYTGEGSPASELALNATLVSAQQTVGTEVTVGDDGAVTVNYPSAAYCADVAEAVKKYSRLTGTSAYGSKSFDLTQQTAFLNFEITFTDGTASGTALSAVVSNGGSALCTANRTTETVGEKVVAKFVLPVAGGTTLSSATVKMGDKAALAITNATLTGKVYNVKRTYAAANPYATAKLGDLFYSDGTFSTELEAGKTPIGVIAYLGTDAFSENGTTVNGSTFAGHGLVMCLKNAASAIAWCTKTGSTFSGQEVTSVDGLKRTENVSGYTNTAALTVDEATADKYPAAAAAKNYKDLTAPAGTTGWFLPSAQQWVKMQTGLGALKESSITWFSWFDTSHTAADKWENAIKKAGEGKYDSMTSELHYWSSSEYSTASAVSLRVDATYTGGCYGFCWDGYYKVDALSDSRVRPVLAF